MLNLLPPNFVHCAWQLFHQVPGAGNRITLIDTAAIVPGSLSNKGADGGVIAGPRSEMPRPFLSLGPGGAS